MRLNKVFLILALVLSLPMIASADQNDQFSVGDTTATGVDSFRVLDTGDVVPGISNRYSIGVASLTWDAELASVNSSTMSFNQGVQSPLAAGATIYPTSYLVVCSTISNGNAMTLTSKPTITTGTAVANGMFMVITATAANCGMNFQDDDTMAGSSLELGASSRTVSISDTLSLIYDALQQKWKEVGFGNNDN